MVIELWRPVVDAFGSEIAFTFAKAKMRGKARRDRGDLSDAPRQEAGAHMTSKVVLTAAPPMGRGRPPEVRISASNCLHPLSFVAQTATILAVRCSLGCGIAILAARACHAQWVQVTQGGGVHV